MPTTYAHDQFGKQVAKRLSGPVKELILSQKDAFLIGVHGPDILFYYRPFHRNTINSLGIRMHREVAAPFFRAGRDKYLESRDPMLLSYLLGFICHYMLDSTCHPYIGRYMEATGAAHDEIETEFDRLLMKKKKKNPFLFHPSAPIRVRDELSGTVARVLGITAKEAKKTIVSTKFYTNLMVCPNEASRKLKLGLMKALGVYDSIQGHIMRKEPLPGCRESTEELYRLWKQAIPETAGIIEEFCRTIEDREYLNPRFDRNYE